MPRLPKDYSKGLIYKFCCKDTTIKEIYIGSTTNFTKRKNCHKNTCNNPNAKQYNYKVYQFIRDNGGWDNWEMILIEYYSCETELLLCRRENYWKNELQASLNSRTPHIYENDKEYEKANKEQIAECYKANKEQKKVYHQEHREQIAEYQKKYNEANKEQIAETNKEYYKTNKEQILEQMKKKITCECGCIVSRGNMKRHERSAKHIDFISAKSKDLDILGI